MRAIPVSAVKFSNSFKSLENEPKVTTLDLESTKPVEKDRKALPLVTSALALAAVTVSAVALKNNKAAKSELEKKSKEFAEQLQQETTKLKELYEPQLEELKGKLSAAENNGNKELIEALNGQISDLSSKIVALQNKISEIKASNGFPFAEWVNVNGKNFHLASIYEGSKVYGAEQEALEKTLKTESARRIFGIENGWKDIPNRAEIGMITSEYKGIASTGGMSIVPKEIAQNIVKMLAGRQEAEFTVYMPLYRGKLEQTIDRVLKVGDNGKLNYVEVVKKNGNIEERLIKQLEKVHTMRTKVYTDTGIMEESTDVLLGEEIVAIPNFAEYLPKLPKDVQKYIEELGAGQRFDYGTLSVTKGEGGSLEATAKIKQVFFDKGAGGAYDLNVAEQRVSNIYNNFALSSGETERFVRVGKDAYELFVDQQKPISLKIPHLMIGNDWQSGSYSAIQRLLTPVKKAYGELDPILAERIYNIPNVTIMHNAGLAGGVWHSQEKLLNIMFGDKAATIVKNAHMPNTFIKEGDNIVSEGLSSHLWNGLLEGEGLNPQMMALAYSDYIIPVSKGYATEIATKDVFGGARKQIFELRAHEGRFSDKEILSRIIKGNGFVADEGALSNPTMFGVVNGCDRANNTLTEEGAKTLANRLGLPEGAFKAYVKGEDSLLWHNHNKKAAMNQIIEEVNKARLSKGVDNPMLIEMPELTDLSGVTEKTPVFVSAGRIVDQKGLDIFAEGIKEFYRNFEGGEYPVFYVQGIGDPKYKEAILAAKREVAQINPEAAKRIVFANLFSQPGRYDAAKLIADFSVMPSWFEPCGLSHKEIAQFSGAGAVVNRTGGLVEDLTEGVNVLVSEFNPDKSQLVENGKNFASAMRKAVKIHADAAQYREVVDSMMSSNFDWARPDGSIQSYTKLFERLNVLNHDAATAAI